jgi:hypothetical protein
MRVELAFGVVDVGHPPAFPGFIVVGSAFSCAGLLSLSTSIPWRRRSTTPTPSPFTDIGNNITTSNPERIDFTGCCSHSLISTQTGSTILLTRKWHCGGHSHREVKLHNVELTSIVDFRDAHDVTPLLLPVDNPLALF